MKKLVVLHNKISLAYFETKCIKSFSYNTGGSQFLITLMILKVSGLLGRTKISAPNKLFSPFQHFVKRIKTFSSLWMRILLPQILCINELENFTWKIFEVEHYCWFVFVISIKFQFATKLNSKCEIINF